MILEDGWKEYIPVSVEPTQEEYCQNLKYFTREEAEKYGSSENVDVFYINEIKVWLDKLTRTGLMLRFQSEKAIGKTDTTLWYNEISFLLNIDNAIQMLYMLEAYASACYDNTQKHLANINKLTSVEELKNYDFTTGYPDKLIF
jgi:hypothetical protein